MNQQSEGSHREAKIRLRRWRIKGVTNHADIESSLSASTISQEVTQTDTQPAPTTVEVPQATSDAAARPTPSTIPVETQTPPTEKSSPTVEQPNQDKGNGDVVMSDLSGTAQPAPSTVEAPQATSDAAACPTSPSTVLLDTQTPTEKSSPNVVIQFSPSHADPTASMSDAAPHAVLATPPITEIGLASEPTAVGGEQPNQDKGTDDAVMSDSSSLVQEPQNDVNLPPWLVPMIEYLRGVATDTAWQTLVTEFVKFEKGDPPTGVSSFSSQT